MLHRGYQDIAFPFLPLECPAIAMEMPWNVYELLDYLSTWSAVKLYDQAHGDSVLAALRRQLEKRYAMDQVYNVKMDFFVYMGRK